MYVSHVAAYLIQRSVDTTRKLSQPRHGQFDGESTLSPSPQAKGRTGREGSDEGMKQSHPRNAYVVTLSEAARQSVGEQQEPARIA